MNESQEHATLRSPEVAKIFGVNVKTVTRWAGAGKLRSIKTPGGKEYRFFPSEVYEKAGVRHD